MIQMTMTRDTADVTLSALHYIATCADTERERLIAQQTFAVLAHALYPQRYPAQPLRWADEPMPIVEVGP